MERPRSSASAGEDLSDDGALGVRVLLEVLPIARRELALHLRIQLAIRRVRPQVVAESEHPLDLFAACREDVQVDVRVRSLEQAVLIPLGFTDRESIASRLKIR